VSTLLLFLEPDAKRYSVLHAILFVFDLADCCSRRSAPSSKRSAEEISLPRRGRSNRGYRDGRVGDVEWG